MSIASKLAKGLLFFACAFGLFFFVLYLYNVKFVIDIDDENNFYYELVDVSKNEIKKILDSRGAIGENGKLTINFPNVYKQTIVTIFSFDLLNNMEK